MRRYKTFEEPTAQFYAAEVCLILEFLHEKEGVAYRDLKPENILIDADGHLKLVDFGFAKKLDGSTSSTPSHSNRSTNEAGRTNLDPVRHTGTRVNVIGLTRS